MLRIAYILVVADAAIAGGGCAGGQGKKGQGDAALAEDLAVRAEDGAGCEFFDVVHKYSPQPQNAVTEYF
ncbi:hypothetical protein ACFPRE_13855 [Variovorax soli]|uniref:hypothetical protein n=1 Tax=Variovorax soli TaxID=376815 RepID=UPI00137A0AC7